jgi:uncharacterized protein GlcG (DUF336 family)
MAFTSAATGTATEQLCATQEDRVVLAHAMAYPRPLVPIAGGCPVYLGGSLLGGFGAGGARSSSTDYELAAAALSTVIRAAEARGQGCVSPARPADPAST